MQDDDEQCDNQIIINLKLSSLNLDVGLAVAPGV